MSNGNGRMVRVQSFFTYPVPVVTLAAGASGSSTLRIESATDFLWFKSTFMAEQWVDPESQGGQDASTYRMPSVDVQIQVSGSDRNLMNGAVAIPTLFGTGEVPFVLPAPMVLLANSEVRFDFKSRESTNVTRVALCLIGLKDYGELRAAGDPGPLAG